MINKKLIARRKEKSRAKRRERNYKLWVSKLERKSRKTSLLERFLGLMEQFLLKIKGR